MKSNKLASRCKMLAEFYEFDISCLFLVSNFNLITEWQCNVCANTSKKPALRLFARCQGHGEDVNFSKLESHHIDPNCCDIGTSPSNDLHPKQNFDLLESFPAPVHPNHIVIHSNPLSMCHGESFSCRSLNLGGTFLVKFQVAQWNWSSLPELKNDRFSQIPSTFAIIVVKLDMTGPCEIHPPPPTTHLWCAPVWFVEPKLADVWAAQRDHPLRMVNFGKYQTWWSWWWWWWWWWLWLWLRRSWSLFWSWLLSFSYIFLLYNIIYDIELLYIYSTETDRRNYSIVASLSSWRRLYEGFSLAAVLVWSVDFFVASSLLIVRCCVYCCNTISWHLNNIRKFKYICDIFVCWLR